VQGEVKIEHNPSKSGKNHSSDIEATVTVDSIRQASGNDLAASIVLDGSGSMGTSDPNRLRVEGAKEFVDVLDSRGNFVSAVFEFPGFNSADPSLGNTDFFAGFTNDTDSLDNAIEKAEAGGGTPMYESLAEVLEYSENERSNANFQKGIVLLADGQPNGFGVARDSVCRSARQKNSPIFGIGLGPASDLAPSNEQSNAAITEMRQISSCTGGAYQGLIPDSLEVVEQAFSAAATSSSQGSINYAIKIENGLSQLDTGDTIRGTLTVSSGGSSASGTFTFTVPASSSTSRSYKYK
jgi:hypothetical protein